MINGRRTISPMGERIACFRATMKGTTQMSYNQSGTRASKGDSLLASICHLSGLFDSMILPILIPVVVMFISDSEYVTVQAKRAINFQLSCLIWAIISCVLAFVLIGIPMLIVVAICSFLYPIIAGISVLGGGSYEYPRMWFMRPFNIIK
jgi:uncharacterized Tic20 family protein